MNGSVKPLGRTMLVAVSLLVLTALTMAGCSATSKPGRSEPPALRPLDISLDAAAIRAGARVVVAGKVYQERRKPDGPDEPLAGTVVTLLPYSAVVRSRLDALKRGARESVQSYVTAALNIRKLREAYEAALWDRGAADLVLTTTVGPDGTFRFEGVPAGHWLLYATHAEFTKKAGASRIPSREGPFLERRRFEGFYAVTVWLKDLRIGAATPEVTDLTDRNFWFNGVAED